MSTFGGSGSQGHVSAGLVSGRKNTYLFNKKLTWPQLHSVRLWRRENLQLSSISVVINRTLCSSFNKESKCLNFVIRRNNFNNLM